MKSILEKVQVEALIPQKAPFVMVDKLFYWADNKAITGFKVPEDTIFAEEGRFTESGIIEHMAQSVALHSGYCYHNTNEDVPTGYIGAIKEVTILQLPLVGDELITEVLILQEFMGITLVDVTTKLNGTLIATSQMKTVIVSGPQE
jgi:predicted hotdog family 3-hydroxylacyl-ACP dehydratase